MFFLVQDLPPEVLQPSSLDRTAHVLLEVVKMSQVRHREMASAYLLQEGYRVQDSPELLMAERDGASLDIRINEHGLITDIGGRTTRAARRWWQVWK